MKILNSISNLLLSIYFCQKDNKQNLGIKFSLKVRFSQPASSLQTLCSINIQQQDLSPWCRLRKIVWIMRV